MAGRKTRGVAGLKKEEQKKLNMILLGVIGGGMVIVLLAFGIAAGDGQALLQPPEEAKKEEPKVEEKPKEKPKEVKEKPERKTTWGTGRTAESIHRGNVEIKVLKPVREAPPETLKEVAGDYPQILVLPDQAEPAGKTMPTKPVKLTNWSDDSLKDKSC